MKTIYSLLAYSASLVFGYVFVSNLKHRLDFSHIIFLSLLVLLFFIFMILGTMSFPRRHRSRRLFYNSYSNQRTKNESFDKFYSFMNE